MVRVCVRGLGHLKWYSPICMVLSSSGHCMTIVKVSSLSVITLVRLEDRLVSLPLHVVTYVHHLFCSSSLPKHEALALVQLRRCVSSLFSRVCSR